MDEVLAYGCGFGIWIWFGHLDERNIEVLYAIILVRQKEMAYRNSKIVISIC